MGHLIVNADDFGRAPGVSRGIVEAHLHGIVTSTTLMVNLPWVDDAVALARGLPRLGIGLHLTFSYGPPVLDDVASLVGRDGLFHRDLDVLRHEARHGDLDREAPAQLQRFVAVMGSLPTHLDSHQHVHTWPTVSDVVSSLAIKHGLPVRAVDSAHRERLTTAGVRTTDVFYNDFYAPGSMTPDKFLQVLTAIPNTGIAELMCHPGYDDDALSDSSFRTQREDELRVLCSDAIRQEIERRGIELVSYSVFGT